jgi:hypothetical protein
LLLIIIVVVVVVVIVVGAWIFHSLCELGGGVRFSAEAQIFLFVTTPIPAVGPNEAPVELVTGDYFPWKKRPGRKTGHLPTNFW